jgi:hypothetical protein
MSLEQAPPCFTALTTQVRHSSEADARSWSFFEPWQESPQTCAHTSLAQTHGCRIAANSSAPSPFFDAQSDTHTCMASFSEPVGVVAEPVGSVVVSFLPPELLLLELVS